MRQEYPKYKYHRELPPVVVHSHEEHEQLGDDWKDSPAHFIDVEEIPGGVVSSESAAEAAIDGVVSDVAQAAIDAKAKAEAKKEAAAKAKAAAKAAKDAAKAAKDAKN
jgi:hypothetical protein